MSYTPSPEHWQPAPLPTTLSELTEHGDTMRCALGVTITRMADHWQLDDRGLSGVTRWAGTITCPFGPGAVSWLASALRRRGFGAERIAELLR